MLIVIKYPKLQEKKKLNNRAKKHKPQIGIMFSWNRSIISGKSDQKETHIKASDQIQFEASTIRHSLTQPQSLIGKEHQKIDIKEKAINLRTWWRSTIQSIGVGDTETPSYPMSLVKWYKRKVQNSGVYDSKETLSQQYKAANKHSLSIWANTTTVASRNRKDGWKARG